MKLENANGKRYFGLHMCEGVAEYSDPNGKDAYRILVSELALKKMDASFEGKPVFVQHVDDADLPPDGYVVKSFYNPADGKHWVEFLVCTPEGHNAISTGWKLSNAYIPKEFAGGGKWHNVDYLKEVMDAEYEHLAIVPNPRYSESIVLTPDEFKAYNSEKEAELKKLANSKGEPSMLKFFTKKKLENALEIEDTTVVLKSGTEKTIKQLVNEVEAAEDKKKNEEKEKSEGKPVMANEEHMVECGEKMMSVAEMKNAYMSMMESKPKDEPKKENVDPAEDKEALKKDEGKENEKKPVEEKKVEEKKDNEEEKKPEDKKENEEKKEEEKKEDKKENSLWFDKMSNAAKVVPVQSVDLSEDKVARGKARYGSN